MILSLLSERKGTRLDDGAANEGPRSVRGCDAANDAGVIDAAHARDGVVRGEIVSVRPTTSRMSASSVDLHLGQRRGLSAGTCLGRYHVLETYADYTTVELYTAIDTVLSRKVLLCLLPQRSRPSVLSKTVESSGSGGRSLRDILALAKLGNPHLVSVYDAGISKGYVYWAMELVPGASLGDYLRVKKPCARDVFGVVAPLASALAVLHEHGYFCGALSFDRISVEENGRARLWTLGVSGHRATSQLSGRRDGRVHDESEQAGMAPEVRDGGSPSACADVYSFCVLLARALGLDKATESILADGAQQSAFGARRQGRGIPPALLDVLRDGLERNPSRRIRDGQQLAWRLQQVEWPTRGRYGWYATASLLIGGLWWATSLAVAGAPGRCRGEENAISLAVRQLEQSLVQGGASPADAPVDRSAIPRILRLLGSRAEAVRKAKQELCFVPADALDEQVRDQRGFCLHRHEAELSRIVRRLQTSGPRGVEDAITSVNKLTSVEACLEDAEPVVAVHTAEQRRLAAQLAGELVEITTKTHDGSQRLARMRAALAVATSAGLADWERLIESAIYEEASQLDGSHAVVSVAAFGSLRGEILHDERRRVSALLQMSYYLGFLRGDMQALDEFVALSRSASRRDAVTRELDSDLLRTSAIALWASAGIEAALADFGTLYEESRRDPLMSPKAKVVDFHNYAVALAGVGRTDEALEVCRAGLALAVHNYGAAHRSVASLLRVLLAVHVEIGYSAQARGEVDEFFDFAFSQCGDQLACLAAKPDFETTYLRHLRESGRMLEHLRVMDQLHDARGPQDASSDGADARQTAGALERAYSALFFQDVERARAWLDDLAQGRVRDHVYDRPDVYGLALSLELMLRSAGVTGSSAWARVSTDEDLLQGVIVGGLQQRVASLLLRARYLCVQRAYREALSECDRAIALLSGLGWREEGELLRVRTLRAEILLDSGEHVLAARELDDLREATFAKFGSHSPSLIGLFLTSARAAERSGENGRAAAFRGQAKALAQQNGLLSGFSPRLWRVGSPS